MTNKELRERTCFYADESGSLHVEMKEEARFSDLHVPRVGWDVVYPSELPEGITDLYLRYFTTKLNVACRIGTFCDTPSIILIAYHQEGDEDFAKKAVVVKEKTEKLDSEIVVYSCGSGDEETLYICIPYLVPEDVVLRAYFIADTIFAKDAGEAYTALENADNLFNMPDELAADYRRFLEKHSENIGVLIKCPPAEEMEDLHVHIGTDSFSFECLIAAKCNDDDAIDRFQQRMSDIKASFLEMADNKRAKCNWMSGLKTVTLAANDVFGFNQWHFIEMKHIDV